MKNSAEIIGKIVLGVFATIGILFVLAGLGLGLAFPIKWTWNATMPIYLVCLL